MATQKMDPVTANLMARHNLLRTGIPMIKRLAPVNAALGSSVKIPLLRMGIMTGILLQFSLTVKFANTGDPTPPDPVQSPVGPWNLVNQVKYTDFAGVDRTRTHGYQLWAAQSMKQGDLLGVAPQEDSTYVAGDGSNIFFFPTDNTKSVPIYFSLYIPLAYDPRGDLTGSVMTATNVGEHYVTVNLADALVGSDPWVYPYTDGQVDTVSDVKIEAFQFYIQPQNMNAENLPIIDLSTIYGFEGGYQTTANINANQDIFIDYPNNRSILSALMTYENGSAFTAMGTDVTAITLVANSNTNFREMTPRMLREIMRNIANADLSDGTYYISSRQQPILTQLYANVQAKFAIANASGSGVTQFISQYESQYPSGSPLPGITVAA